MPRKITFSIKNFYNKFGILIEYFVTNKQAIISAQVLIKNIKKKLEGNNVVAFQKFIFSLLITNIIIKNRNETEDDDLLMKNA